MVFINKQAFIAGGFPLNIAQIMKFQLNGGKVLVTSAINILKKIQQGMKFCGVNVIKKTSSRFQAE